MRAKQGRDMNRLTISIRRGKPQASMRIAPQLLAKLVTLDLAGRRARQIVGRQCIRRAADASRRSAPMRAGLPPDFL